MVNRHGLHWFFILSAILFPSFVASANGVQPSEPFDRTIDLVLPNFPVNGFMFLVIYFIFVLVDGPPVQQGLVRHLFSFLISIGIVTFSGALIDTVAFLEDDMGVYIAAAALIMCIVFAVCFRYLRMSLLFSVISGLAFFVWNMIAWVVIEDWFWILVDSTINFYLLLGFLVLCVFTIALFYHHVPASKRSSADLEATVVEQEPSFKIDRRFYLDYWLPLEALLFCLVLLYLVVYITEDPIFVF